MTQNLPESQKPVNSVQKFIASQPLTTMARKILIFYSQPWGAGLLSLIVFLYFAYDNETLGKTTIFNYYSYLADALMHGQLHLRLIPPFTTHDLVFFQEKYYLYWPPFPALMVMPFVVLFGIGFSDVTLTVVLGAFIVFLAAKMIKRLNEMGFIQLSPLQMGILIFTFALGTPFTTQAPMGHVWATGQLFAILFVFLAYMSALTLKGWKAFFWTGLFGALTLMTRNHLVFNCLWLAYFLLAQNWNLPWRKKILYSFTALSPVIAAGLLMAAYNYVRFGSFEQVGLDFHQMAPLFQAEYNLYGAFNLFYLPRNLFYHWIAYPFLVGGTNEFFMGGSLFLLTPLFFAVFWAFRNPKIRVHAIVLAFTCLLVYVPISLLMGTGWVQFGSRYLMDFIPPLLILTAMGMESWSPRISGYLAAMSFIQFLAGIKILFFLAV